MKTKLFAFVSLVASVVAISPSTTHAITVPPNPGDFAVAIQPGAPAEGQMPNCTPALTSIGDSVARGETVTAVCTVSTKSASSTITGTASNPTLAASTGDAGFASGTITAVCSSSQDVNLQLAISLAGQTMNSFSGKIFQGCTFSMDFQDAAKSKLLGTIEVNGVLGNEDGTVVNNVVNIEINAKVFITSGTGAFAGYAGTGTFNQSQEINIDPNSRPAVEVTQPEARAFCSTNSITPCTDQKIGEWCNANRTNPQAANCLPILQLIGAMGSASVRTASVRATADADANTMKLTLAKSAGRARILSPAPPAGSPTGTAKVKASTKIKVTAPAGSVCTVKTATGRVVGTGKVSGKYASVSITPRSGAYKNAQKIVATCKTTKKKTLTSNSVKVKL